MKLRQFGKTGASDLSGRTTSNPEAEATLQRQRGLVLPNAAAFTPSTWAVVATRPCTALGGGEPVLRLITARECYTVRNGGLHEFEG